jgi:OOP family OmpA-OmpF porin
VYAARLGFAYRAQNDPFGSVPQGSEVIFGGAAGMRFANGKMLAGPEIFGSTVVTGADAFFSKAATPFEVLFGMHYTDPSGVRLGGGFGPGLTRGLGAPQLRFVVAVEWAPALEEPAALPAVLDRDNDGVLDANDACPDNPGPPSTDPKKNGCQPSADRDKDGVPDTDDVCPDQPGLHSDDPMKDGCPPAADRDNDGVLDKDDACPDAHGVQTANPKTNGCPLQTDSDNDGVLDTEDACPTQVGPRSKDPKKNGCPGGDAGQIKITGQVMFDANSAEIPKESEAVLNGVAKILIERKEIQWVRVEGHTDNRGEAKQAKVLSVKRAEAVVDWLGKHGVDLERLMSQGFGGERPIDSNDTEQGRKNNRRVEFHVGDEGKR